MLYVLFDFVLSYAAEMSTSLQKEISEVRNQITENAEKVKYDNLLESKAQEIQDKYDTVTDLELYFFIFWRVVGYSVHI